MCAEAHEDAMLSWSRSIFHFALRALPVSWTEFLGYMEKAVEFLALKKIERSQKQRCEYTVDKNIKFSLIDSDASRDFQFDRYPLRI